jgi:hypothetical protein
MDRNKVFTHRNSPLAQYTSGLSQMQASVAIAADGARLAEGAASPQVRGERQKERGEKNLFDPSSRRLPLTSSLGGVATAGARLADQNVVAGVGAGFPRTNLTHVVQGAETAPLRNGTLPQFGVEIQNVVTPMIPMRGRRGLTPLALVPGVPTSNGVDEFLSLVASQRLSPNHGQGRLPLLNKGIVAIYSLERDQNVLVVQTQNGARMALNLSSGTLKDFRQDERKDVLVREGAIEKALAELQKANDALPIVAQNSNCHVLMIHLDGFGKNKGTISNLLIQLDRRIGENTHVVLAGPAEELSLGARLTEELTLKHKTHFYTAMPDSLKKLSITHLTPVDQLRVLKGLFTGKNDQWVSMESLINREDGKAGVFIFPQIADFVELVASRDRESARNRFNEITGYKISLEEFNALIQGDLGLAMLYPIRPLLRTLLRDAERIYILSRSVISSA